MGDLVSLLGFLLHHPQHALEKSGLNIAASLVGEKFGHHVLSASALDAKNRDRQILLPDTNLCRRYLCSIIFGRCPGLPDTRDPRLERNSWISFFLLKSIPNLILHKPLVVVFSFASGRATAVLFRRGGVIYHISISKSHFSAR